MYTIVRLESEQTKAESSPTPLVASSYSISLRRMKYCASGSGEEVTGFADLPKKHCSTLGSVDLAPSPSVAASVGTGLQPRTECPSSAATLSTAALAVLRCPASEGKKNIPMAYSPSGGSSEKPNLPLLSRTTREKKACGIATRHPAPSPVLYSQPQAPRCVMRTSISSASATQARVGTRDSSPTKPTPQASRSSAGS